MNAPDADFIIIGSGPAGVSAAFPLIVAGRRVLMLDAGDDLGLQEENRSVRVLGSDLESLRVDDGSSPKLQTPVSRGILERFQRDAGISGNGFKPIGSLARGGLSNIWGAQISYLDAGDIADWPIDLASLQSSTSGSPNASGSAPTPISRPAPMARPSCRLARPPPMFFVGTRLQNRRMDRFGYLPPSMRYSPRRGPDGRRAICGATVSMAAPAARSITAGTICCSYESRRIFVCSTTGGLSR